MEADCDGGKNSPRVINASKEEEEKVYYIV